MENKQKNPRRRLNSLILLVAFTAVMLIVSTYAWFSAQKNVTVGGLEGKVNVAEGLMISLDAKNWAQEVDLKNPVLDDNKTLANPYGTRANNLPSEMLPVSTTAAENIATWKTDATEGSDDNVIDAAGTIDEIPFYTGININGDQLHSIQNTDLTKTSATDPQYPGYFAIDLFLQNSSKIDTDGADNSSADVDKKLDDEKQGRTRETLQLNTNSLLKLLSTGNVETTGLQYTTRVALALFQPTDPGKVEVTDTQADILDAYSAAKICDVAIWEPNADQHVDYVVTNNNDISWDATVKALYLTSDIGVSGEEGYIAKANRTKFLGTEMLPTYALTTTSKSAAAPLDSAGKTGIYDIYDWDGTTTSPDGADADEDPDPYTSGMTRQIALQTAKESDYSTYNGGVRNLVSVRSSGATVYQYGASVTGKTAESGMITFDILKNLVSKIRMYVWLEGQDVDTINYASHGGGVYLDLGLVKGATPGQQAS